MLRDLPCNHLESNFSLYLKEGLFGQVAVDLSHNHCILSPRLSGAHLMGVHVDAHQEDELRHEEAAAQVLMDGGPGALDLTKEPEGEDAHGQTDEGDDHPQLGDAGQDGIVRHQLRSKWEGRCFIHSFMVW